MPSLPQHPQSVSPLFQLSGEIRNMIYEFVGMSTVYATLKSPKTQLVGEKYIPHRISLLVRVPPAALISTCQRVHEEAQPLFKPLHHETPRILISCGHVDNQDDYYKSREHTFWRMKWCLKTLVKAGWSHAMALNGAYHAGVPAPKLRNWGSMFLGMTFENEYMAAMAAVFTDRLGHYLLWRCGNDVKKLIARDIGDEPLFHVAVTMFDTDGAVVRARLDRHKTFDDVKNVQVLEDRIVLEDGVAEEIVNQGMMQSTKNDVVFHLVYPELQNIKESSGDIETSDRVVSFEVTWNILNNDAAVVGKSSNLKEWQADWGEWRSQK